MIINADGLVVGRIAATAAKAMLNGEDVVIVNADRSVMTGNPKNIVAKYAARRAIVQKANPQHAPHWPKRPDMLLRRIVRGMLPFDKPHGRAAFKRLRVYMDAPAEVASKAIEIEGARSKSRKFMSLAQLSKELGWYGQEK